MIDPKELRIGNLVIDELGMRECVLCGITNIDAHYMLDGIRHIIGHEWFGDKKGMLRANPIPITPEWLERLGFENLDGRYTVGTHKHPYDTDKISWDGKVVRYEVMRYSSLIYSVKYVHQLQNLYFALTGEELKIKDNA